MRIISKGELLFRREYRYRTLIRIKVITLAISEKYIRTIRLSANLVKSPPSPLSRLLIFNRRRPSRNRKMPRRPSLESESVMCLNAQRLVVPEMHRCQVFPSKALTFSLRQDSLKVCITTHQLAINSCVRYSHRPPIPQTQKSCPVCYTVAVILSKDRDLEYAKTRPTSKSTTL